MQSSVKKAISPVAAMTLLLLVVIVSIASFQGWFQSFTSQVLTEVEDQTAQLKSARVDGVVERSLYIFNERDKNISVKEVKVGGRVCSVNATLSEGLGAIDISSCIENISGNREVVVTTTDGIFSNEISIPKPTGITFSDRSGVAPSQRVFSTIVSVDDLDASANVSIDGPASAAYRICDDESCSSVDHSWTSGITEITSSQYLQLAVNASEKYGFIHAVNGTMKDLTFTWQVTTTSTLNYEEPAALNGNNWTASGAYEELDGLKSSGVDLALGSSPALRYDGIDDRGFMNESAALRNSDNFTVSAWAWLESRTTSNDNINPIVNKQIDFEDRNFWLVHWQEHWYVRATDGGSTVEVQSDSKSSTKQWVHLAVVADDGTLKLYIDGVQQAATASYGSLDTQANNLRMGHGYDDPRHLDGKVDDVRMYDQQLSSSEVQALYEEKTVPTTNLVGHWRLDEGSGDHIADVTGGPHNGTLIGPSWTKRNRTHGYRVAKPISLEGFINLTSSSISWDTEEPGSSSITLATAVTSQNTTIPLSWQTATNASTIPGLTAGMNVTDQYLWLRQNLTRSDRSIQPKLKNLTLSITQ